MNKNARIRKYRYFITDDSNVGFFLVGKLNGIEMLLLIGYILYNQTNANTNNVAKTLINHYKFELIEEKIKLTQLIDNNNTKYTYYHLFDDNGYQDADGYSYVNIKEVYRYFCGTETAKMLNSVKAFQDKRLFS